MRIFILMAVLAVAPYAGAQVNIEKLNQILKKSDAQWVAKSTPISQLSAAEARLRMGLPMQESSVEFQLPAVKSLTHLPPRLDWREKDGGNWVTPILDQGQCGSCVAFATIGVLETQTRIATGFSGFNVRLSPQHAFACGGGACQFGWFPEVAARYLQRSGVPDEACMPYTSGATGVDLACNSACSDSNARSVKLASYSTPTRSAKNIEAAKQALQNGPLVTTLMVYEDFMAYASGVYKHTTGEMMGGHAISIVGYDDNLRAFAIRNSWGETWGEKGFGWVSYDDLSGVGDSTWSYNVAPITGGVTVQSPVDWSYASGVTSLQAQSTFSGTDSMMLVIDNNSTGSLSKQSCSTVPHCAQDFDTTQWPDGRYEIYAIAFDSNGRELGKSHRQFFYISNTTPTLSLSFSGNKGLDLSRPLRERVEILVSASSSTVPMNSAEFHYRGADGVVHSRTASVVVNGMIMGWRTTLVPNGSYEIWMTGRLKTATQETVVESAHMTVQVAN
ncbi:MAG: hypothetical protein KF799_00910 [Bdellovibrionales bacterium]|nr:hypothetical protein [Bdellovibrionales bacterium]